MKNLRQLHLLCIMVLSVANLAHARETLYNGIVLPDEWPPRYEKIARKPMPVPYLKNPPVVISIDIGRQLFVDDFLIETTTMTRTFHQADYYRRNPVLAPETTAEVDAEGNWMAGPFSGGAWYDPVDSLFKLWYRGAGPECYATSTEGMHWGRPNLDVNPAVLLHHFTCTPANPQANDRVTINAYDKDDRLLDLGDWDIIEFCFSDDLGCVETGNSSVTINKNGGAVFTVTQAMLDRGKAFDFNAYKASAPPNTEVFVLPFPFNTIARAGNVVYPFSEEDNFHRDSVSIWLDHNARASERFKWFATEFSGEGAWLTYRTSPDGIHWSSPQHRARVWGDRTTVFYNPFREVWACSQRIEDAHGKRTRSYVEGGSALDLMRQVTYNELDEVEGQSVHWVGADNLDPRHTDPKHAHIAPELYTLDAAPYESLMLGQFSIWQGPRNSDCDELWVPKRNDILLGFSRDGFHWDRPDRTRFISSTWQASSWRFGNVQSCVGGPLVVGDKLYFYFNGRPKPGPDAPGWDADFHTGLAILRRDGFASMDANTTQTLTTRPVIFTGKWLFVNVDCPQGELKAEVLDKGGKKIKPLTLENCKPVSCDKTLAKISWKRNKDLSCLAGKPVRFRFHLRNGSLYAFWVSPDASGASHGFVGAGGPGFPGPIDTVGQSAAK